VCLVGKICRPQHGEGSLDAGLAWIFGMLVDRVAALLSMTVSRLLFEPISIRFVKPATAFVHAVVEHPGGR